MRKAGKLFDDYRGAALQWLEMTWLLIQEIDLGYTQEDKLTLSLLAIFACNLDFNPGIQGSSLPINDEGSSQSRVAGTLSRWIRSLQRKQKI